MNKKTWAYITIIIVIGVIMYNTVSKSNANKKSIRQVELTTDEKLLIDSIDIEPWVLESLRGKLPNVAFKRFKREVEGFTDKNDSLISKAISFNVGADTAIWVIESFGEEFYKKGYLIFRTKSNFGFGNKPDEVTILKTANQFDALSLVGTNAYNYDKDEEWVYNYAMKINKRFPYRIIGAEFDAFEARFISPPTDWLAFAQEIYEECPDIVDQGSGTVKELAKEMSESNGFVLWWD